MATDDSGNTTTQQPISPEMRRRLQKCFEHGNKSAVSNNFDYATEMFTQCVVGDPGNLVYIQAFMGNLQKKYNNNKKGSKLAGLSISSKRNAMKAGIKKKDWDAAVKAGVEALKLNPWDIQTLLGMAEICEQLGHDEPQLYYLKVALDTEPKNVDINRACGLALGRMGQFDQAIACWHRVQQLKPGDDEAPRQISNLSVDKTIARGFEVPEAMAVDPKRVSVVKRNAAAHAAKPAAAKKNEPASEEAAASAPAARLTREEELEKALENDPTDVVSAADLAELYTRKDRYGDAERVLRRTLEASGGDLKVREQLEDTQIQRARHDLAIAERQAARDSTEQTQELAKQKKKEALNLEKDVYRARSERRPDDPVVKFELGVRLKKAGDYMEAIKVFQELRNDSKRKGTALLELGECFQHIKQFKLSMSNYESAIDAISDKEEDLRKLALYRAGVLAMGLKDLDKAEKYLTELAGIDFAFKDVADRLDKIAQARHKQ